MIRFDRLSAPPDILATRGEDAFDRAYNFYRDPLEKRIQRRWSFDQLWLEAPVTEALLRVFHHKCAFCEIPLVDSPNFEHFRPYGGALNQDGTHDPDHYWWLAYQWHNLYPICERCKFNKANKFPVTRRRPPITTINYELFRHHLESEEYYREMKRERALLLDPCLDTPDDALLFLDDGTVVGIDGQERGQATIDIFGLNRDESVKDRAQAIIELRRSLDQILRRQATKASSHQVYFYSQMQNALSLEAPYLAAKRQFLARWLQEHPQAADEPEIISLVTPIANQVHQKKRTITVEQSAIKKSQYIEKKIKIETEKERIDIGKARYIRRIEIRNFRAITKLELDFPPPASGYIPWMVLLGENGVGKSSVLKAAAMALMDEDSLAGLSVESTEIMRIGATHGWVKVYISGYEYPFELHFRKGDRRFYKYDPAPGTTPSVPPNRLLMWVFGYGGTRLLPIGDYLAPETLKLAQVHNLFNPFIPLKDAREWLTGLAGKKGRLTFGNSARAIKTLLQSEDDDDFKRRNGRVYYKPADSKRMIPLESLSDGYQSTIALAVDIMSTTLKTWNTAEDSEGIVLLDEIDVHLHPGWKMQIINALRATFPRMQFLITTHDPLCLLGTRSGEVHVLTRSPEDERIIPTQVDLPPGITPDQLLTGYWFGLPSVYDSETRGLLDQHRQMLRQGTPQDDSARLSLEASLRQRLGTFNETSVDRLAQSVASQIIAEEARPLSPEKRKALRDTLLEMVKQKREASQGS